MHNVLFASFRSAGRTAFELSLRHDGSQMPNGLPGKSGGDSWIDSEKHANSTGAASSTSLKFCILKFLNESLVFTFSRLTFSARIVAFPFCVHGRHRPAISNSPGRCRRSWDRGNDEQRQQALNRNRIDTSYMPCSILRNVCVTEPKQASSQLGFYVACCGLKGAEDGPDQTHHTGQGTILAHGLDSSMIQPVIGHCYV